MKSRVAAGVLAVVATVGLVGCSGAAPKPSPTPTPPFASADAAYKAAEATYRGYVDALNEVQLEHQTSFKPVFAWLLGSALEGDKAQFRAMSAKGWKVSGDSHVTQAQPLEKDSDDPRWGDVTIAVCLDVRSVNVVDAEGVSQVASTRPAFQAINVTVHRDAGSPTGLKISDLSTRAGAPTCGG
ncbi:MAG TPA: hypothetical protein VN107_08270 [Microbacterium sp.]|nr:hypothetical protein [Microbacterium sp.]